MTDIAVIPLWRRPGFAEACLRRVSMAMDSDVLIHICLDYGYRDAVLEVARRFARRHPQVVNIIERSEEYPSGSYNVFSGMSEALEEAQSGDLIHVIEEDILVGSDYFTFHRQAHRLVPHAYGVSACENIFLPHEVAVPVIPDAVYPSGAFQVWGTSFRPERVQQILSRLRPGYFTDMHNACVEEFGEGNTARTGSLYDGVMAMNMAEENGAFMAFPFTPRGYHVGFEGLSYTGHALDGSADEQADRILAMSESDLMAHTTFPNARFRTIDLDASRPAVARVVPF